MNSTDRPRCPACLLSTDGSDPYLGVVIHCARHAGHRGRHAAVRSRRRLRISWRMPARNSWRMP
jgi:hypothetical protein